MSGKQRSTQACRHIGRTETPLSSAPVVFAAQASHTVLVPGHLTVASTRQRPPLGVGGGGPGPGPGDGDGGGGGGGGGGGPGVGVGGMGSPFVQSYALGFGPAHSRGGLSEAAATAEGRKGEGRGAVAAQHWKSLPAEAQVEPSPPGRSSGGGRGLLRREGRRAADHGNQNKMTPSSVATRCAQCGSGPRSSVASSASPQAWHFTHASFAADRSTPTPRHPKPLLCMRERAHPRPTQHSLPAHMAPCWCGHGTLPPSLQVGAARGKANEAKVAWAPRTRKGGRRT